MCLRRARVLGLTAFALGVGILLAAFFPKLLILILFGCVCIGVGFALLRN